MILKFPGQMVEICSLGFVFEVSTFRFWPFLDKLFGPKVIADDYKRLLKYHFLPKQIPHISRFCSSLALKSAVFAPLYPPAGG